MEQGLAKLKVCSRACSAESAAYGVSLWLDHAWGKAVRMHARLRCTRAWETAHLDTCQLGLRAAALCEASKLLDLVREASLQLHAGLHHLMQRQAQGFAQSGAHLRPEPSWGSGTAVNSFKVSWPLLADMW